MSSSDGANNAFAVVIPAGRQLQKVAHTRMHWSQNYDPFGSFLVSTIVAALPLVVLLGTLAFLKVRIHYAALLGLTVAMLVAILGAGMPVKCATAAMLYGAAYGLFPIGWIILNLMFLYHLTVEKGHFTVLRQSLGSLAPDARIQVILIAFCFGAFFEGAAGFGTPVAVSSAILMQLGFNPLAASGLSLIANTAPVAFGGLGTPLLALKTVTDLDLMKLSAMVGRQLTLFSVLIPFWVVWAFSGWKGLKGVWPAALTAGLAFAIPQFLISNFHGPWLVGIGASLCSIAALSVLLKFWAPRSVWGVDGQASEHGVFERPPPRAVRLAWTPWLLLSVFIFLWGLPPWKNWLNGQAKLTVSLAAPATLALAPQLPGNVAQLSFAVPALHDVVLRSPPVASPGAPPEKAIYTLNWLSATGTGILTAAVVAGLFMGFSVRQMVGHYLTTLFRVRFSLLTIAAMLAIGYVTKYSGTDATLGLALAKTGPLYPFFGTLLGWLGVALTGSDTASNVLFGSLQKITAEQTGLSSILMTSANSAGGVMGKMVDAQSIVVASTATNWYGHEDRILRYVFWHSLALATLVGIIVFLQAKVYPFTETVVQ